MICCGSTVLPIGYRGKFMIENKIKVLVVGAGNMGRSHALAYASIPEFEIAAICTRSPGVPCKTNVRTTGWDPRGQ